eukprot:g11890.t1
MASVPDKSQKQACRHCGRAYDSLKQDVCQHCKERREMGRAPIRVVMDMEAMSELPRSYPPIVPGRGKPKMVPGLPVGYSVPLEAFTIEERVSRVGRARTKTNVSTRLPSTTAFARQCQDGQRLLERQKLFNDGKIDPRYQWLEERGRGTPAVIPVPLRSDRQGRARVEPKPKKKASSVRSFMSSFFGAQTAEGPPPLSGVQREDPFEKGQTSKTVIARNGLVSTYTNEKLASGPFRPAPRKGEASESADDPEGDDLDQQLKDLLARTCAKPIPVE